jgi:hypothetical protein
LANFTITVSNYVNTFGGITNKWNAFTWGSFKWGEGTADLPVDVMHVISESITPSSATPEKEVFFLISNDLPVSGDLSSEDLQDGAGYNYVFVSNASDAENRDFVTYTSGSVQNNTSYTSLTAGSTVWS